MTHLLHLAARQGRLLLIFGLLIGALTPSAAQVLRGWLPELVALLLFLTAFRVGLTAALGSLTSLRRVAAIVIGLQLGAPLFALAVFGALGVMTHPFALAVVLMLAAPSVTGAPNFLIMLGADPAHALRILVFGTAVFPVTVIPVLWGVPGLDGMAAFGAALELIAVILGATVAGFAARRVLFGTLSDTTRRSVDGIAAIALTVIVVGLMSEIGPLMKADPLRLLSWAVAVLSLNFGLQIATHLCLRRSGMEEAAAVSLISGNRNIALFLIALPPDITGPLMVFIGCYQIPMYLTPVVLCRLYAPSV